MTKYNIKQLLTLAFAFLMITGCYKEQHFNMPGPYDNEEIVPDTFPFPFSENKDAGIYLVKDGKPDFSKILFKGYSDFKPAIDEQVAWGFNEELGCYESVQCFNFYPLDNKDHYGNYDGSYKDASVVTKPFVQYGDGSSWYFYAKMAFPYLAGTAPYCWFGGTFAKRHVAGWDGSSGFDGSPILYAQINGQLIQDPTWPTTIEVITPGEPFDFEIVCVDYLVYVKINGRMIWYYNVPRDENSLPITICPWRNSLRIYDVYMEGDIKETQEFINAEYDNGYRTVQAPSLAKTNTGEILLLAEGRKNNMELTNDKAYVPHRNNECDIIMQRSSDNANTWSDITVVTGNDGTVNFGPMTAADENGNVHLIYTKDPSFVLNDTLFSICHKTFNGSVWSTQENVIYQNTPECRIITMSGHGVCADDGTIVMPVICRKDGKTLAGTLNYNEQQSAWTLSIADNTEDTENLIATGATVSKIENGQLMLLMANNANHRKYKVAYSENNGATWGEITTSTLGTSSYGSRNIGTTVVCTNGEIVHICPETVRSNFNNDENRMTGAPQYGEGFVCLRSSNNGEAWSMQQSLLNFKSYSGYYVLKDQMDAIEMSNGEILVVSESGIKRPVEGLAKDIIR